MWLLDVNMPNNLTLLLREFGVDAETARSEEVPEVLGRGGQSAATSSTAVC
jgi:hypothetical protein